FERYHAAGRVGPGWTYSARARGLAGDHQSTRNGTETAARAGRKCSRGGGRERLRDISGRTFARGGGIASTSRIAGAVIRQRRSAAGRRGQFRARFSRSERTVAGQART